MSDVSQTLVLAYVMDALKYHLWGDDDKARHLLERARISLVDLLNQGRLDTDGE